VLGDIFVPAVSGDRPTLPYWVTNATVYENGAIFPFTPDILDRYKVTHFNHRVSKFCVDVSGNDCTSVSDYYKVPVSVGVKASATFPGAVAATTLGSSADDKNPFLHLFDGGIADNLGVLTAMDLLSKDPSDAESTMKSKRILIIIDAFKGDPEAFSSRSGSPTVVFHVGNRLTSITLDSWHGRFRSIIGQMAEERGIEIVYLDFESLTKSDGKVSVSRPKCNSLDRSEVTQKVRQVATAFNVEPDEQLSLVCAGYIAVGEERDRLASMF